MTERNLTPEEIQNFSQRLELREKQKRTSIKIFSIALTGFIGAIYVSVSASNENIEGAADLIGIISSIVLLKSGYDFLLSSVRSNRIVNYVKQKGVEVQNERFMKRKIVTPEN